MLRGVLEMINENSHTTKNMAPCTNKVAATDAAAIVSAIAQADPRRAIAATSESTPHAAVTPNTQRRENCGINIPRFCHPSGRFQAKSSLDSAIVPIYAAITRFSGREPQTPKTRSAIVAGSGLKLDDRRGVGTV
jgi:hypothetical protein